jgi:hypothetical protein
MRFGGVKLIISDIMANLGITGVTCMFNWRGKVEGHYMALPMPLRPLAEFERNRW